ncbi:unnamed protein product [Zymoseptoria tritici ST99CH_1A5]|uniref:Uncharacterized protein n=4 Tax=Zymoseptoria tritici TaxID=1047171 RepID=F9XFW7_ZYMTI|nr:uncharacterized protein MYCGRDRAFT_100770 [Zymoseptoria tritici IPO323]SMQ52529.1 unnamed protein product [Zymoseptoria tritici ST99CH_3D7]SMR55352.1 unnamed protein product [Zymoseptoria tritici ST99CH_1E4]SMR57728.1 unnamed protein product [Zymoseptoria tritici ST99CH_3D1]SMY26164.1 unnamed protein product [Zymoseptoria tritici ST99CH_1A5]EGP85695.1 hypothetical protein MYCGRDRAFT_100770 [Zymoseptoria tritici IPO323]
MASQLAPEQAASYSAIIDRILAKSDLNTVSAKSIRKGLQAKVDYDLAPQKTLITALIMERFDKFQSGNGVTAPEPAPTANGITKSANGNDAASSAAASPPVTGSKRKASSESDLSDVKDDSPVPKKVKKSKAPTSGDVESDEKMAARLQAELNAQTSSRATRGGNTKRKTPAKKATKSKKKSAAKIGAEDDSDLEGGSGVEKPEKEKKGGFHKPMHLSEPLAAMLGENQLSRPQTVKRIWAYVKERDLQEPTDKRQINCDEAMRAVFKSDKVHMFTMNKLLVQHLWPVEEADLVAAS